VIFKTETSCN